MNNLNALAQMNVSALTHSETETSQGGNETFVFTDDQGYKWSYEYNDAGTLISVTVEKQQCVY